MAKKQPNEYRVLYRNMDGVDRIAIVNAYSAPLAAKSVKQHFKVKWIEKIRKVKQIGK